jgi:hypothetical protein
MPSGKSPPDPLVSKIRRVSKIWQVSKVRFANPAYAVPTSTAVEQWYSMLVVPKHQMTSLLSCGT